MRKRYPFIATAAVVALVSIPLAAQAHDGSVSASCTGLTVHLTNYPAHSSITGSVDGKSLGGTNFGPTFDHTITWDPSVNHSYDITVTSGDGDHKYDKHYSQEVTGCAPTPTPSQTPTSAPTPSTPVTPVPSETPKPPVTVPPTQPSSPSSPTVKPSTAPSKPYAGSTQQTPTSSATATEAPVAIPVVAPATFTG